MKMLLLAAAAFTAGSAIVFAAGPFQELSFDAACQKASAEQKLVLIDFFATWCGPCKMLDETTWRDAGVVRLLTEKSVAVKIDAEQERALAERYQVRAYPTLLILKPDGSEIDRLIGYREAPRFREEFTAALSGKTALTRAREAAATAGGNDPMKRQALGRELARQGQEAEALAEFLWCYDEGVKRRPSFVGARSSFLLGDIAALGQRYEPALAALRERRDAALADLVDSDDARGAAAPALDFAALNRVLGENGRTFQYYDRLPSGSRQRSVLALALFNEFVAQRRYADAVLGYDPRQTERLLRPPVLPAGAPAAMQAAMLQSTVRMVADHFEALAGAGRIEEARALAARVVAFSNSAETLDLLRTRAERAGHPEAAPSAASSKS